MRKTKTTIRLAAAMLAPLPQIQTALAEAPPAGAERAEFISLTPENLYEVNPADYVENPEALDESQLFYTPSLVDGEGNVHPPSLLGSALMLVFPYKVQERQELPQKRLVFCKGRLDNLIQTSRDYWSRPSTAFFSALWPESEESGKVRIDFSRYGQDLKDPAGYEALTRTVRNPLDLLLRMQMDPTQGDGTALDFRNCPWNGMLEKSSEMRECIDGDSLDQPVVDELCSRLERIRRWPKSWLSSTFGTESRERRKRGGYPLRWTTDPMYILNMSPDKHNGWLALKNYEYHEWDFEKVFTNNASSRPEQDDGAVEAEREAGPGNGWHFIPLSGAIKEYEEDEQTNTEVPVSGKHSAARMPAPKAVAGAGNKGSSPGIAKATVATGPQKPYILAIAADWQRKNYEKDALSLNKDFQWEGGHRNPVRVPEYSRVNILNKASGGKSGLLVTWENNEMSCKWVGDEVEIKDNLSQSPIAYPADIKEFTWKVIVALPGGVDPKDFPLTVESNSEKELFTTSSNDSSSTSGSYNLARKFKTETITHEPIGGTAKMKGHEYKLYCYTVLFKELDESFNRIQRGEMHLKWKFGNTKNTAKTNITKIYTIFGPSTWQTTGEIAVTKSTSDQDGQILPWEKCLKRLTQEWLHNTENEVFLSNETDKILNTISINMRWCRLDESELPILFINNETMKHYNDYILSKGGTTKLATTIKEEWKTKGQSLLFADETLFKVDNETSYKEYWGLKGEVNPSIKNISRMIYGAPYSNYTVQGNETHYLNRPVTKTDPRTKTLILAKAFAIFDPSSFCKERLSSMAFRCMDASAALASIPRICGFTKPINIHYIPGHAFNSYEKQNKLYALDATPNTLSIDNIPLDNYLANYKYLKDINEDLFLLKIEYSTSCISAKYLHLYRIKNIK